MTDQSRSKEIHHGCVKVCKGILCLRIASVYIFTVPISCFVVKLAHICVSKKPRTTADCVFYLKDVPFLSQIAIIL